jgi:molybdate-binding protein/transcriptional regulator with XRE-family HTH domain
MASHSSGRNRVRDHRTSRGWSQADLARRAGVSRAAVSAIEIDRLVPSVAAALGLAAAFGCTVETLFGAAASTEPEWAWPPAQEPCRYWQAVVGGRFYRYPVEAGPAAVTVHDGVCRGGQYTPRDGADPGATLVVASCDPAAALLAAEYARATGFRLLVLPRSGGAALDLLGRGLVHVAGVHFATPDAPDGNARGVAEALGQDHRLLRVADWQEGLAVAPSARVSTVGGALRADLRWVGREPGSAARQCLDELRPARPAPRRLARDHRGVAEAVRCGWADVGVCHRLAAEEAGLAFLPVRQEGFDLSFPAGADGDPRVDALVRLVRSAACRRLLGDLPGFDTRNAGEVRAAV